jgi:hypothetical protein
MALSSATLAITSSGAPLQGLGYALDCVITVTVALWEPVPQVILHQAGLFHQPMLVSIHDLFA